MAKYLIRTKATNDTVVSAFLKALGIDPKTVVHFKYECGEAEATTPAVFEIAVLAHQQRFDGLDWGKILSVDETDKDGDSET
jgi:hypothetical protein